MDASYTVPGFDVTGIAAGIKASGALDMALLVSRVPCHAAATFTQNAFPAAPVVYDKRLLELNPTGIHGVVINSGCANACTGTEGSANTRRMAEAVEKTLGADDHSIMVMSTGVIGVQLPIDKMTAAAPRAVEQLRPDNWPAAAQAIMTTDTRPKLATRQITIDGQDVRLTGIAKGAGMIHPNMATLLSTIVTDAAVAQPVLQQALSTAVQRSFNRISVDGDTSTNDTVALLANGLAGHAEIAGPGPALETFQAALTDLCVELAQALVRDGEGVTKFVTIHVHGAASDAEAHHAANTVATSPLVKTAFFGNDANWGRILAAVGRAGIQVDPERCSLFIKGGENAQQRLPELQLVAQGVPVTYAETEAAARFAQPEIDVRIDLGLDTGEAIVWTCDLSHEYVNINADYRS